MKEAWQRCTVADLMELGEAEVKTGPFGTQLRASDYLESGTPVINVRNVGFGEIRSEKLEYIGADTVARLSSHLLRPGDIVFGRKGAVERHAFIQDQHSRWFQGSDCIRLRLTSESILPRFVSYSFLTEAHKHWMLAQGSHGATMASLNQDIIGRIPLALPSLAVQQRIVDVLSAYDDLIENNTRRIAILEEMARAIYREWFVDFRFPGHEQVEMVDSELGPVPAGWDVRRLGEIASALRRNVQPKNHSEEVFAHFSIPAFDTGRQPKYEAGATISSTKHEVGPGVVLISKLNPRIPRVWLPELPAGHRSICSTEFVVLEPTTTSQTHLFSLLNSDDFQERLAARAGGTSTSHQRVKPADLLDMAIVDPSSEWVTRFTSYVAPMLSLVAVLRRKNSTFRQTRDLLLPKLISGEIDVPTAEDALARAVA